MTERPEGQYWTVDAAATLQSLLDAPECPEMLRRALTGVYSWQARNETTVGRALRASQLAPQWLAALLALGATVSIGREVPLEHLPEEEAEGQVTALHVPIPGPQSRWGEAHVGRTPADEPIVAAFAVVRMSAGVVDGVRVALTGVWPRSVRLAEAPGMLVGEPLSGGRIRDAAAAVEEEVEPREDYLGSTVYRRAMAGVLTRRALEACATAPTAGGGQ